MTPLIFQQYLETISLLNSIHNYHKNLICNKNNTGVGYLLMKIFIFSSKAITMSCQPVLQSTSFGFEATRILVQSC